RRRYRLNRYKRLVIEAGLFTEEEYNRLYDNYTDIWKSREEALDRKLTKEEFVKILKYLCKMRGFKSNRKNKAKDKETGKVIASINENKKRMQELHSRNVAEYINEVNRTTGDKYSVCRNKDKNYNLCVNREMIEDEIKKLFENQRKLGATFASIEFEEKYLEIFNAQRPFAKFEDLENLVGYCTYENKEKRAPKNCISAEEFKLYDNINKLSIFNNGKSRKLTDEERRLMVDLAYKKSEIKYKDIRKLLNLNENESFSGLTYNENNKIDKTENVKYISMYGYHEIRKAIEKELGKKYFDHMKNNRNLMNNIAYVLTLSTTDEEVLEQLKMREVNDEIAKAVVGISFSKFNNLSIKALENILPYVKEGDYYNVACEKAGYNFKETYEGEKTVKLPDIEADKIRNPVVARSLSQLIKVINSIIEIYGSPAAIHIELARDLSKNHDKRKEIKNKQDESRAAKDKLKNELKELLTVENPSETMILKYRLWKEQNGECAYSQMRIPFEDLYKLGMYEIDHIIPISRSFDNSYSNKVVVKVNENQNKGNKTPYEYFGNDEARWSRFQVWVENSNLSNKKKNNLLIEKFSEEDWKTRNLNDTRYISKYINKHISDRLVFRESSIKKKVTCINGKATSYLRICWHLKKSRESDKHHALDATVIACATDQMIHRICEFNKALELKYTKNENDKDKKYLTKEELKELRKQIPKPWKNFSQELKIRLSDDPIKELEDNKFYTYDEEFIKENVKPILVSKYKNRKVKGAFFKEKVYSPKSFVCNKQIIKKKLCDLKLEDMENIYNYATDKKLYDAINEKLKENGGNAKEAFKDEFRKPTKNGELGPVVKSIKILSRVLSKDMVSINNGFSCKDGLVRLDIYIKDKSYYCVPIYRIDIAKGQIPNKAVAAKKNEDEWDEITEEFKFKFSLYKNDLIEIKYKNNQRVFGYYNAIDINAA
ncbi:MAG TPA: type II CRISPR RNA-guided endonuclease Cas9, partial [Clostridium sp.]|nr:type II CRISPR RNA-guided endonuclease Cas9 [Clostridium sp.]